MEVLYTVLLTWAVTGVLQWFSWVVKVEYFGDAVSVGIDSHWQWILAGPIVWTLRAVIFIIHLFIARYIGREL